MSDTKLAPCPKCCPAPYRACFEASDVRVFANDDDTKGTYKPIWRCNNCGHEMPRRVLTVSKWTDRTEMTESQEDAARRLIWHWADLGDVVLEGTIQFSGRRVLWSGKRGTLSRAGMLSMLDTHFLYAIGPNGKVEDLMAKTEKSLKKGAPR